MLGLNHPKCKVSRTKAVRNWAYTLHINDPLGSCYVIFEIRNAVQPRRQKQGLTIVVESAITTIQSKPTLYYGAKASWRRLRAI